MKINDELLSLKKGGFIVPVAIAVLVVASIGLFSFSWWRGAKKEAVTPKLEENTVQANINTETSSQTKSKTVSASNDGSLDSDSSAIDAGLRGLDESSVDVNSSFNDTPDSL